MLTLASTCGDNFPEKDCSPQPVLSVVLVVGAVLGLGGWLIEERKIRAGAHRTTASDGPVGRPRTALASGVNAMLLIGLAGLGIWRLAVHDYVVGLIAIVVAVLRSAYLLARK